MNLIDLGHVRRGRASGSARLKAHIEPHPSPISGVDGVSLYGHPPLRATHGELVRDLVRRNCPAERTCELHLDALAPTCGDRARSDGLRAGDLAHTGDARVASLQENEGASAVAVAELLALKHETPARWSLRKVQDVEVDCQIDGIGHLPLPGPWVGLPRALLLCEHSGRGHE